MKRKGAAKKKASWSFPWRETLGAGIGAIAIYKLFFSGQAKPPTAAPTGAPPVVTQGAQAHGPSYERWANTIQNYHTMLIDGIIGLPEYQARLLEIRQFIDEDYRIGRLSAYDLEMLNATILGWGV